VLRLPDSGEVFAWTSGSSTMVPINDLLGSTVGLVSSTGSLATQFTGACPERSRGKPFGKPSPTTSAYPYLFAGMEYDNTTGLYHTQARYYSPVLQRFLSEDPLRHGAGVNFFSYAGNDPVNEVDRLGLFYFTGPGTNTAPWGGDPGFGLWEGGTSSNAAFGGSGCANVGQGCHITLPSQVGGPFWGKSPGIIVAQEDDEELDPQYQHLEDQIRQHEQALELRSRQGFKGQRGFELRNPRGTTRNSDETIGGRRFSGHALDQMQNRGLMPSLIEDTISRGVRCDTTISGRSGYYSFANRLTVIIDADGSVVTVIPGRPPG
jgi:RHS repeat-associated protein